MQQRGRYLEEGYWSNRACYKATGLDDDDLARPVIGIANAFNEMVAGHSHLRRLAEQVKYGIYRAGGTPREFGVIACCDGIATGHDGNRYVLPSRDLIADSIETQTQAHKLDGLVLLGSCDKIVPGMLMAAARLKIPSIFLAGGCMLGGAPFGEKAKSDSTTITEALGLYQQGQIQADVLQNLSVTSVPTCGSCQNMGTANTMCCFAEALGMSLPGSAVIPAVYLERDRCALQTGVQIVQLVQQGLISADILTRQSLANAIMVLMAIGGSTNSVLHSCALGHELGIEATEVLQLFDRYSREIPYLAKMNPASDQYDLEDFYRAGGIPEVMVQLRDSLYTDGLTVTGQSVADNLQQIHPLYPVNRAIIATREQPHSQQGGLAILYGNLAPDSGVAKPAAMAAEVLQFTGEAICFDSEEDCTAAIASGRIKAGHVIVVRYEGPKGGPGMREMYQPMKMLHGQGLATRTALITDGRFSGTNNGCFVGHISPEAAAGGPLALVQDGDGITIDVPGRQLTLHVSDEELAQRRQQWVYHPKPLSGYLARYARLVSSASKGAILEV